MEVWFSVLRGRRRFSGETRGGGPAPPGPKRAENRVFSVKRQAGLKRAAFQTKNVWAQDLLRFLRGKKPLLLAAKRGFFPLKLPHLPQNPPNLHKQIMRTKVFPAENNILFHDDAIVLFSIEILSSIEF
ncbi:hypothetical protein QUW15_03825 [Desulfovibrio piger]|nr:hypothetical protein [Desulfovibrio piger]